MSLAELCALLINTFEKLHIINLEANLRDPFPADIDVFKTSPGRLKKVMTSYYQTRRLEKDVVFTTS